MNKTVLFSVALACIALFPNGASADAIPTLEIVDTGPDAIIVARDLELGDATLKVRSNRIEVALEGRPPALNVGTDDSSIASLGIRIRTNGERRLTITLKGGRDAARRIARSAQVEQIGDSVQVILARKGGAPAAAFVDDYDQDAEPEQGEPAAAAGVANTTAVGPTAKAAPVDQGASAAKPSAKQSQKSSGGLGQLAGLLLIFVAAAAAGLGYREWQKRRSSSLPLVAGIEVLSVRNVGPKTRILLVAVGDREMLLSIGPGGSTVLGRWRRNSRDNNEGALGDSYRDEEPAPTPMRALDRDEDYRRPAPKPLRASPPPAAPIAAPPVERARPLASPPPERVRHATANPAKVALARRDQAARMDATRIEAPQRRAFARGSSQHNEAVSEWNHRPTSPSVRGILELRDQSLALEDVLGQSDDEVDIEWEQALASGTRAGRLR